MDELMKQLVRTASNVGLLAKAVELLAKRCTQQDAVIAQLSERVASLEAVQGINKAMYH